MKGVGPTALLAVALSLTGCATRTPQPPADGALFTIYFDSFSSLEGVATNHTYLSRQFQFDPAGGEGNWHYKAFYSETLCDYSDVPTRIIERDGFLVDIDDRAVVEHMIGIALKQGESCRSRRHLVNSPGKELDAVLRSAPCYHTEFIVYDRRKERVVCRHEGEIEGTEHETETLRMVKEGIEIARHAAPALPPPASAP